MDLANLRKDLYSTLAIACAVTTAIFSLGAIAGWTFDWLALARIREAFIPMAPATAIAFAILSASLLVALNPSANQFLRTVLLIATAAVTMFCVILIYQFAVGIDPGIEQDIFHITGELRGQPLGRMSPVTTAGFLMISTALLLRLSARPDGRRSRVASAALALLVALAGLTITIGYLYGTPVFYSTGIIPVAMTTGLSFLTLGVGAVLAAGPLYWPLRLFAGASTRARLFRATLPAVAAVILVEHFIEERFLPEQTNQALVATGVAMAAIVAASIAIQQISSVIGISIDTAVSEREKAERELERIFNLSADLISISDFNGYFLKVNPAFESILGYSRAELLAKPYIMFVHPDDVERTESALTEKLVSGETLINFENRYRCRDGEYKWLSWNSTPLIAEQQIFATARDITERKQAEKELRDSEEKYRNLFENSNVGMYRSRLDGSAILDVNENFASMYGYTKEEMIDRPSVVLWADPQARQDLVALLQETGSVSNYEAEFLTKDGAHIYVLLSAKVYPESGIIEGANIDITERKHLEQQLFQAQKMESIGRMAGGIAHDFNNYLTAMQGFIDLALMDVPAGGHLQDNLMEARGAAEHAADLTRQLLQFARREHVHVKTVGFDGVIQSLQKVLNRLVGERYEIDSDLPQDLWLVKADAVLMEQVIMNLVVNARDAMPAGGKIGITAGNVSIGAADVRHHSGGSTGDYVRMAVTDAGDGMDPETVSHIFEPFFSTKESGKGTGLGLTVVYGIIRQHNGWIDVDSAPGKGTTFSFYLPAVTGEPSLTGAGNGASQKDLQGHGERILLVEDQDSLRSLAARMLSENGYEVYAAANAREARRMVEKHQGDFQLIFSDIVMPGESGVQLVESVRREWPRIKALFVTGYSVEENLDQINEMGMRFMYKPYALDALLEAVRDTLAQ